MTIAVTSPQSSLITSAEPKAKLLKEIYWIEGLFCPNCASALEHKLLALDHVKSVSVSFAYSYMAIHFYGDNTTCKVIETQVKKLGYTLTSANLNQRQTQLNQQKKQAYSLLFFAFVFSMWSMLIALVTYIHDVNEFTKETANLLNLFSGFFAVPVVFIAGFHFHKMAWFAFIQRRMSIDFLISTSALLAFFISCYFILIQIDVVYFDTACMLILLHLVGRTLDLKSKINAIATLQEEIKLAQNTTVLWQKSANVLEKINIEAIVKNQLLVIHQGESIPVDCQLISASSLCNTHTFTGEAEPVLFNQGQPLSAGYINLSHSITVLTTCSAGESVLDHQLISILINKAKQVNNNDHINRFSSLLSKLILCAGLIAGIYTYNITGDFQLTFERILCVLVIACPCSLTIATPLAALILNQQSIKHKMVINNAAQFAKARHLTRYFFDKTGTLTQGQPTLESFKVVDQSCSVEQVLNYAYQCAYHSGHLYSELIRQYCQEHNQTSSIYGQVQEFLGKGLRWRHGDLEVHLGAKNWLISQGVNIDIDDEQSRSYLAINRQIVALFNFTDQINHSAQRTLAQLVKDKLSLYMLSGDNHNACLKVAKQLPFDQQNIYSQSSPEQKQQHIMEHQQKCKNKQTVAFFGDGINDNLALIQADIGIACYNAKTLTKVSATACLLSNDLSSISKIKPLAALYYKLVNYNVTYAIVYNIIAIPIAIFATISPVVAISAMAAGSLSISLNTYLFSKKMNAL